MRTTVTLDEALLGRAGALSGLQDRSTLLAEALRALIERESARRLARLGGSEPQLEAAPRRREAPPAKPTPAGSWPTPPSGSVICVAATQ